jgi:hypothetical protein
MVSKSPVRCPTAIINASAPEFKDSKQVLGELV